MRTYEDAFDHEGSAINDFAANFVVWGGSFVIGFLLMMMFL